MRDFGKELQRAKLSGDGIGWTETGLVFMPDVEPARRAAVQALWDAPPALSMLDRVRRWIKR